MNKTYRNLFFFAIMKHTSSIITVFKNRNLLSEIFDFLGDDNIRNQFIPKPKQILIYGQVQSGKTAKIIEYIKNSTIRINILFIQNSLSMLAQYENALRNEKIRYCSISSGNSSTASWYVRNSKTNIVLLVMNNYYRRNELDNVMIKCKISKYSLIMDESDLYHDNLKKSKLYNNSIENVHVTATPFLPEYNAYFDKVVVISPKKEYISFDKLDIKFIPTVEDETKTIMNIIKTDFLKKKQGIMLITIHNRVTNMLSTAHYLSKQLSLVNVPIAMLSSKNILYYNKKTKELPKMSISQIISGLENHQHIIFIANRLASRGINYSNLTYTRHLTHQLIGQNDSKTNFIQKCRILGNKQGVTEKLKLYCLGCQEEYFEEILKKIKRLEKNVDSFKLGYKSQKPKLVRSNTL